MTTGLGGPVSAALEADLRSAVRRHGIVVWLDQAEHYTGFVDRLRALRAAGALPYEVHAFRGSHLALLLELDGVAAGTRRRRSSSTCRASTRRRSGRRRCSSSTRPAREYRKALDTLVNEAAAGPGAPRADQGVPGPARPHARRGRRLARPRSLDGATGGLGAQLRAMSPAGRPRRPAQLAGFVASRIGAAEDRGRALGAVRRLDRPSRGLAGGSSPPGGPRAEDVAFAAAGWALCGRVRRRPEAPAGQATSWRPPPICRARSSTPAAPSRRTCGSGTRASIADGGRDGGAPRRRGRGGPGRGPREDRHVPLRGGQGPAGGAGRPGRRGLRPGRRVGGPAGGPGDGCVVLAPRRPLAPVRLAARRRRGPARAGDRPRGRRRLDADAAADGPAGGGRHRLCRARCRGRPGPPATWSSGGRLCCTRRCRSSNRSVRASTGCASLWRDWADRWARGLQRALQGARIPAGHRAPAADDLRRGGEAAGRRSRGRRRSSSSTPFATRWARSSSRTLSDTPATTAMLWPRLAELPTATEVGMNVLAPVADHGRLQVALAGDTGVVLGFQTGEFRVSDPETPQAGHARPGRRRDLPAAHPGRRGDAGNRRA